MIESGVMIVALFLILWVMICNERAHRQRMIISNSIEIWLDSPINCKAYDIDRKV